MRQKAQNVSPLSNEGRNTYVKEHITEAFLSLLSEQTIQEISVSRLCDKAGVGRASFYRNFESKEDILKAHISTLFQEWITVYETQDNFPLHEQIKTLFQHFEKHYDFYRLLYERGLTYLLKDAIIGICGPKPQHSKTDAYATAFFAYSLYGWIEVWFQRGMQESAEEMAELFRAQGL